MAEKNHNAMLRNTAILALVLFMLESASLGQTASSRGKDLPSDRLETALHQLQRNIPKWRAALAAVDVDALQVRYSEGRQIESLKTTAIGNLEVIQKSVVSLNETSAPKLVLLLLQLKDEDTAVQGLGSVLALDDKIGSQATVWIPPLQNTLGELVTAEETVESPVLTILTARDALVARCNDHP